MYNSLLFREQYRISSTRLSAWDYRSSGHYFVTWKVKGNARVLGNIHNGLVRFSRLGKIVESELYETMIVRPDIVIDTFVVMPDHVHVLFDFWYQRDFPVNTETPPRGVSTARNTLFSNSLGSIVGQIKSQSTKRIRTFFPAFSWQLRFHDRIARNDEISRIRQYIMDNPKQWTADAQ